ncbi:MAG: hypothetical protein V3V22_04295 [Methylococcales bacterium]
MEKSIKIILTSALFIFLTSCATVNQSEFSNAYEGSVTSELKADIDVGEKISGTSSGTVILGILTVGGETTFADGVSYGAEAGDDGSSLLNLFGDASKPIKAAAAYNAISGSNADVIVAPKYITNVTNYYVFKRINVTVSGYKGTVNSIQ